MRAFFSVITRSREVFFWILCAVLGAVFVASIFYFPLYAAIAEGIVFILLLAIFRAGVPPGPLAAEQRKEKSVGGTEFENIVESIEDTLVVYDTDLTVSLFNPAAEKLFGAKKSAIVGRKFSPEDAKDASLERFIQVLFPTLSPTMIPRSSAGAYPQVVDLAFQDPYLELRVITSPILDRRGETVGFVKVVRDRTHEVSLLKSKSEFIAIASHQLRTPITNIEWVLQSSLSSEGLDENTKQSLQNALISANQLKRTVEDLLHISKIEDGRFGYEFTETDIVAFLESVLEEAYPEARRIGISLYFERPKEPLPPTLIDSKKLGMAVANLIDNAIRYNTQNGKVVVEARKQEQDPYVEISIRDTGIGISHEDIQKIFTKFFRAENATRVKANGSGLGLYIVKNIVQSHGGRVWAESEEGRGSTFYFTIPTDSSLVPPIEAPVGH